MSIVLIISLLMSAVAILANIALIISFRRNRKVKFNAHTDKQKTELIEKEKAFQLIRKKQINGMYLCIQTFNIGRIVVLIGLIILIIFA